MDQYSAIIDQVNPYCGEANWEFKVHDANGPIKTFSQTINLERFARSYWTPSNRGYDPSTLDYLRVTLPMEVQPPERPSNNRPSLDAYIDITFRLAVRDTPESRMRSPNIVGDTLHMTASTAGKENIMSNEVTVG